MVQVTLVMSSSIFLEELATSLRIARLPRREEVGGYGDSGASASFVVN